MMMTRMDTKTEDLLWQAIADLAGRFSEHTSHRSDAFELLACLLAYYQSRGTSPEEMISAAMKDRITFFLEHPPVSPKRDKT